MPRKRLHDDPLEPLPRGLYRAGRRFRARRHGSAAWEYFEGPYDAACKAYRIWKQEAPPEERETTAYLMDWYLTNIAPNRVKPATLAGYKGDAKQMARWFGHVPYAALTPALLAQYRDERGVQHVKQEFGFLSGVFSAAIEHGLASANPVKAVRKPSKRTRVRCVTNAEYLAIYNAAPLALGEHPARMLRIAMRLALRTCQRPADVLRMGIGDVADGVLHVTGQSKTGERLRIALEGDLAGLVQEWRGYRVFAKTFVYTREHQAYTVKGMSGMFRKAADRAGVKDCGLEDLRGKGATDLYNAGTPIRDIQALLGHKTESQTWTYIKARTPAIVKPNSLRVVA